MSGKLLSGKLSLGIWPTRSFVIFDHDDFATRPLLVKFVVRLSGPLFLLMTAMACLGFEEAWTQFLSGFPHIVAGAWAPF